MIQLRNLLEQTNDKPLQVLFVTNASTKSPGYFATRVLAHPQITGDIVHADGNDIESLIKAVSRSITKEYQVLLIQYSGLEKTALNQAEIGLKRIASIAGKYNIPAAFIDNPVSSDNSKFNQLDVWLAKSGLRFIRIGNLNKNDYLTKKGTDVNQSGNDVLYKNVLRYLKTIQPELNIEEPEPDSKTVKDIPNTNKLAAVNGDIVLPAKYRKRTGEATDWETVMDFFIDKGMSKEGAAGIAGNIKVESDFKPDVYGDRGTSIGLAQWHNTRMTGLFKFAQGKGIDPYSVDTQLEWMWYELNNSFSVLLKDLMKATDARDAAEQFAKIYERPSVISPKRMEYAAQYAENYSSIENTIKRGAETVAGAIGRGLTALGTMAVAAAIPSSKQIKTDSRNGQLSTSELKDIGNGQKLSIAAADAFLLMKADAAKEGVNIQLSDSYRSLARQNAIFDWDHYNKTGKRRKKGTSSTAAAYPGTSNHGLGRAIDVSNTAAQKWIRDNGEKYGWSWAEGRAVGEPWHFTYVK